MHRSLLCLLALAACRSDAEVALIDDGVPDDSGEQAELVEPLNAAPSIYSVLLVPAESRAWTSSGPGTTPR